MNTQLPIHFKRLNASLEPPASTHFVVAKNGLFLRKKMNWVDATVPAEKLRTLAPEQPTAKLLLPAFPVQLLAKAVKLAKAVYDISRSEVCLLVHYVPERGSYTVTVPAQIVSPGGIDYDAAQRVPDGQYVGTIHSHGALDAFHSKVDVSDEEDTDGVHITLGRLDLYPRFDLHGEIVVNGCRFPLEESWVGGISRGRKYFGLDEPELLSRIEIPVRWLKSIDHNGIRI